MIASLPLSRRFRWAYAVYVLMFFIYLAAPLIVVGVFAFNDSRFPALPWQGLTLTGLLPMMQNAPVCFMTARYRAVWGLVHWWPVV